MSAMLPLTLQDDVAAGPQQDVAQPERVALQRDDAVLALGLGKLAQLPVRTRELRPRLHPFGYCALFEPRLRGRRMPR